MDEQVRNVLKVENAIFRSNLNVLRNEENLKSLIKLKWGNIWKEVNGQSKRHKW
jgi:hypothetical protein